MSTFGKAIVLSENSINHILICSKIFRLCGGEQRALQQALQTSDYMMEKAPPA